MRVIYNIKYCYTLCLKFGAKFLTFLTKLMLEATANTWSTIKENLLLHCRKSLVFAPVAIIYHVFKIKSASQRNTPSNKNHQLYVPRQTFKWCSFHLRYKTSLLQL